MDMTCDDFNDIFNIGDYFKYYPLLEKLEYIEVKTITEAFPFCGEAHVEVEGAKGRISIKHLEKLIK